MGFIWRPTSIYDVGIDGEIEIRNPDSGEMSNCIIKVQVKATSGRFTVETDISFEYVCRPKDLDYWLGGNVPVILVITRPYMKEAYWICIGEYFKDPARLKEQRVHFDKKTHRFDKNASQALIRLAVNRDSGLYFPPAPQKEKLYSNLLEVTYFPKTIYWASTDLRKPGWFWARAKDNDVEVGGEWILTEKSIMSFHNLRENPWNIFCDRGSAETFEVEEWAFSEDENRHRQFIQLLNQCLDQKLRAWGVRYRKASECYCVRSTEDLAERTFTYQSRRQRTIRTIFGPHASKTTEGRIAYYRHSAFGGQFLCFNEKWFLEINPTYVFTSDGLRESRFAADRLSGIKRLEKNDAVLGQVIMWARFLKQRSLYKREYPFLKFGKLANFDFEQNIDDDAWMSRKDPDPEMLEEEPEIKWSLFE